MTRRSWLGADDGLSLVELLVAVAILGIAFVAIVGGMMTAVLVSDIHRKQATAGTALRAYAETIEAAAYEQCTAGNLPAYSYTPPAGFSASIDGVQVWDEATPAGFVDCASTDPGLQRLQLTVASADGRARETLQVIKRRDQ